VPLTLPARRRALTTIGALTTLRFREPHFFATAAALREWLEENHDSADELSLGIYKKDSGKQPFTLQEAQDQAMCFGWVDSMSKGIDDVSYTLRFTPRKGRSKWNARNVARAEELRDKGLMHDAGLRAFERRLDG
jgi:uncharacterized protein YdeI (YjbR/CyaY-like superfamily)